MNAKLGFGAALLVLALSGPAMAACDPSGGATYVCGPVNPEDMVQVPGTDWIITGGQASPKMPQNNLYLVNIRTRTSKILYPGDNPQQKPDTKTYKDCPGRVDPAKFQAHGVNLKKGPNGIDTLYVVNHAGRESDEIFTVDTRGKEPTVTWTGCVVLPPGSTGNGVAPLPDNGLVATNFSRPGEFAKLDSGGNTGNVMEWHPDTGWSIVPDSDMSAPNGLETSKDGKWIYVAGWGSRTLVRFSRGITPQKKDVIQTGFMTDNVRWSGKDLYIAGQDGTPSMALDCIRSPATICAEGFHVMKVDPVTLKTTEMLHQPKGDVFGGGTTAIRIGNEIWVGASRTDRLAIYPVSK